MKHTTSKLLSLLLVVVLVLSLGTTAVFAEDVAEVTETLVDEATAVAEEVATITTAGYVGIISAMDVELAALVEATEISETVVISDNTFYVGNLNGTNVVLVRAGVGKVLAASCAETLIDQFHVGAVIFTGIAGGVGDDVAVMDIVIGTGMIQHDYGTETNDGFVWNGNPAKDSETGITPVDPELSAIAYDSACAVLGEECVHQGIIVTGDQFLASELYVAELQEKFDALAGEMEGAAVARVADQFGVPCAVIRCMSDKADGLAHETIEFNYEGASNASASVIMDMMTTIAENGTTYADNQPIIEKDTTPRMAIISAMSIELEALVEAAEVESTTVIGDTTYHVGTLNGQDVVMVQAGVGKVLAANGTAALLNNFTVDGVIFTGVAGGVGDDVDVMDMVIGTEAYQADYGEETNDGFIWNGGAGSDREAGVTPLDATLSQIAYDSAVEILGTDSVHQGVITTGDVFVSSETYVAFLQETFNSLACEMEGAAVARVCEQYTVPCAILRCMSDKADGIARDTYEFNYTEAANTSALVVMDVMSTLTAAVEEVSEMPFIDVAISDWCYEAILEVYTAGLMNGTDADAFGPDESTTRGMIVTVLNRLAGEPVAEVEATFADVATDAYYANAIAWAAESGITTGASEDSFAPEDTITREQFATFLYRYAQLLEMDTTATADMSVYADLDEVPEYAVDAMTWAVGAGIITGTSEDALSPLDGATRAQVATMLYRFAA